MRNLIILITIICIALTLSADLFADILNVPDDFETIQRAIDRSSDGDTVLVQPGTYVENILYSGKNIVVGSLMLTTGDKAYIDSTIIDGNQRGSVVGFWQRITADAKLIGFTIQNGIGTSVNGQYIGGGILIIQSDAVIEHCRIRDNHVVNNVNNPSFGGGIACYGLASPTIRDCEIYMNSSEGYGGGVSIVLVCNPTIERVIIRDNSAVGGGGIIIFDNCNVTISYSVISENVAGDFGGGIFVERTSQVDLLNVTVVGNSCGSVGGGVLSNAYVSINAVNSIFRDNDREELSLWNGCTVSVSYCDIDDGEDGIVTNDSEVDWGEGNIDEDPLFVDIDEGNYHLTENSPCIDAGTAFFVWEEDTLINMTEDEYLGNAPDMGAFESEFTDAPFDPIIPHPSSFILLPAYPNPFNSSTTIKYRLPYPTNVSLGVYDPLGRQVGMLFEGYRQAGVHSAHLIANDMSSGLYFVRLEASGEVATRKVMLIR